MRQETMGLWDGSGISWTICEQYASHSRQITTPTPHHSISRCSSWCQTSSVKALKERQLCNYFFDTYFCTCLNSGILFEISYWELLSNHSRLVYGTVVVMSNVIIIWLLTTLICVGCCWCIELWSCFASTGNGFCQPATISCWVCCDASTTDCQVCWCQRTVCCIRALGSSDKLTFRFPSTSLETGIIFRSSLLVLTTRITAA